MLRFKIAFLLEDLKVLLLKARKLEVLKKVIIRGLLDIIEK